MRESIDRTVSGNPLHLTVGTGALNLTITPTVSSGGTGPASARAYLIDTFAGGYWPSNVVATNAGISPLGIAADATGTVYISDRSAIYRVSGDGLLRVFAGGPESGFGGDNGPALSAKFSMGDRGRADPPLQGGLVAHLNGNLYLADTDNNRVRRIDIASGIVTTIAGTGTAGYSGDGGLAVAAQLNKPATLAVDPAGNVYVFDAGNARVRRIAAGTGVITTIVGNGLFGYSGDGGPAATASIEFGGIAIDPVGDLLIAAGARLRKVSAATGLIATAAGTGVLGNGGDSGDAKLAQLSISDVAVEQGGAIFLVQYVNSRSPRIRRIDARTGVITTFAGSGADKATPFL